MIHSVDDPVVNEEPMIVLMTVDHYPLVITGLPVSNIIVNYDRLAGAITNTVDASTL